MKKFSMYDFRRAYKHTNNLENLNDLKNLGNYIHWLESLVVRSDINTRQGIESLFVFEDVCPFCDNKTYSKHTEICLTKDCFNDIDRDW